MIALGDMIIFRSLVLDLDLNFVDSDFQFLLHFRYTGTITFT